jgi:hypothetical protein
MSECKINVESTARIVWDTYPASGQERSIGHQAQIMVNEIVAELAPEFTQILLAKIKANHNEINFTGLIQ